jgi:hypothetical protein
MSYEVKEGTGALFRNDRKEKPSQPAYQGQGRIGGVLYRVSGWVRESKSGSKYLSLSIRPDEREPAQKPLTTPARSTPANPVRTPEVFEFDDDIPF